MKAFIDENFGGEGTCVSVAVSLTCSIMIKNLKLRTQLSGSVSIPPAPMNFFVTWNHHFSHCQHLDMGRADNKKNLESKQEALPDEDQAEKIAALDEKLKVVDEKIRELDAIEVTTTGQVILGVIFSLCHNRLCVSNSPTLHVAR